jgi:protein SCO1/2
MKHGIAFAGLLLALAGCHSVPPLPVYGQVAPFRLVSQDGRAFDSTALAGKIWVADFIFTTCTGPCPLMSYKMRRVQEAAAEYPDVMLVSFTVDPKHDTPPVLAEYAHRYQARDDRWRFLTGETATLDRLARYDFKLGNVDGALVHSTRFVLLDGACRIRGYYSTGDGDDAVGRLLADIARLEGARS